MKKSQPDDGELLLGEDKAHVVLDMRQNALQIRILLQMAPDGLAHHRVLAHQHDSLAPQRNPDLLHLLGADIVRADDEAFGILVEQLDELEVVASLPG